MKALGQDVGIRLFAPGDETAVARLVNNRKVWRNLTNRIPHPYTHEDAVAWIRKATRPSGDARHLASTLR